MKTVTLELDDELASKFSELSDNQKKEIEALIALWVKKPRPILEVMAEASKLVQEQGLTPEMLDELLKDE